jgi:uncharacterized protein YegP (UPF0339 family)
VVNGRRAGRRDRRLSKMAKVPEFEVYRDHMQRWRWRLKAPNGEIIADSGQGYHHRQDCLRGIQLVQAYAPIAQVVYV